MSWFYYTGRLIIRLLLFLFTRWQVRGKQNIPRQGPLLAVVNHLNLADPPVIAVSLNRKSMFMAKEELFRSGFSRYFISRFGAFPVHRGRLDRETLHQAEKVLAQGMVLIVFPEGTRSKNAQLQSALPGSTLLALRSGAPVLPIGISGTERIKGATWWLRRPRITINIGSPFHLPPASGKLPRTAMAELTDSIMTRISELLPAEYRGKYAGQGNRDATKNKD